MEDQYVFFGKIKKKQDIKTGFKDHEGWKQS